MRARSYSRGGQLPFDVFDAIAWSEEEAGEAMEEANVSRAVAEAKSEAMRGR